MSPFHSATTTEALRASWLGPSIEKYLGWLRERRSADTVLRRRVPLLLQFGEFGRARGATQPDQLPDLVAAFVADRIRRRRQPCSSAERLAAYAHELRQPIEQLLKVALPNREPRCGPMEPTFFGQAGGFFIAL